MHAVYLNVTTHRSSIIFQNDNRVITLNPNTENMLDFLMHKNKY